MIMNTAFFPWFFFYLPVCRCSFSSLRAASVCVTTLCLFPTCIIKDTFKLIRPDISSLSSHSFYLGFFFFWNFKNYTSPQTFYTFFSFSFLLKEAMFKPCFLKFSSGLRWHQLISYGRGEAASLGCCRISTNRRADARRSLWKSCIVGVGFEIKTREERSERTRSGSCPSTDFTPVGHFLTEKTVSAIVSYLSSVCDWFPSSLWQKRCHFVIWRALCENESYIFNAAPDKRGCICGLFIRLSAFLVALFHRTRLFFPRLPTCLAFFRFTHAEAVNMWVCAAVDETVSAGRSCHSFNPSHRLGVKKRSAQTGRWQFRVRVGVWVRVGGR